MKILYYNNCWFTNVGEVFIDFGAISLLKKIFPNASIACVSNMTTLYAMSGSSIVEGCVSDSEIFRRCFDPNGYFNADYLVFTGMFACRDFIDDCKAKLMADNMRKNGTKILFLGLGGQLYNKEEQAACARYFEGIKPQLIVTRDNTTYENYKNAAECIRGIDCAFWINDTFDPRGFAKKKYDVVSFNRSREPELFQNWSVPIVRPWHMQYYYKKDYFADGRLVSDSGYDYLTIYANANRVFTDLVHATIPSLVYGVPVKYWYIDDRSLAFEAVDDIKSDCGWLSVETELLEKQKNKIVNEISRKIAI